MSGSCRLPFYQPRCRRSGSKNLLQPLSRDVSPLFVSRVQQDFCLVRIQSAALESSLNCWTDLVRVGLPSRLGGTPGVLTTAAGLERSESPCVLPVVLRLHGNAPVINDVLICFCLMDSLHAYRIANTLASLAKDSHQHQPLFQRLAANTWLLASMNTAMIKTDLMHAAICF